VHRWDFLIAHSLGYFPQHIQEGYNDQSVQLACTHKREETQTPSATQEAATTAGWIWAMSALLVSTALLGLIVLRGVRDRARQYTRIGRPHEPSMFVSVNGQLARSCEQHKGYFTEHVPQL
jgi:hypothetical protein